MPQRKAIGTIHLQRDGKHVVVAAGTTFDFTAEELKDIKRMSPDAVRAVVNEGLDEDEIEASRIAAEKEAAKNIELARKEAEDRAAKTAADKEKAKATATSASKTSGTKASDL